MHKETAQNHKEITKSDTTTYTPPFTALFIGTGGHVVVTSPKGVDAVYKNLPNAYTLQVAGKKVKAATTAADIVALYT